MTLKSPYIYFGGKSKVAEMVWSRFGNVQNYVEPFFGSGAMLLRRPHENFGIETINDKDGFIPNFWRSVQRFPGETAQYADWPVSECDLHARHQWLISNRESMTEQLMADPDWCDPKIAGWWVWGINCWIGGGWCGESSVSRQLPHLGNAGQGTHRRRPHLGDAGKGTHRQRPHLTHQGQGTNSISCHDLVEYFEALQSRMRRVRVCCGDWSRICGPSPTFKNGLTGVFLDPPYTNKANREADLYAIDCLKVGHDVFDWCMRHGDNPQMRIALCGYEGEYDFPDSWECISWKTNGGYALQSNGQGIINMHKERIWFSPHCLPLSQPKFDFEATIEECEEIA